MHSSGIVKSVSEEGNKLTTKLPEKLVFCYSEREQGEKEENNKKRRSNYGVQAAHYVIGWS